MEKLRLGVNIDHVATVRNARGGQHPDPIRAALQAQEAGADGITAHLREDRRHITDDDIARLKSAIAIPLNFEMAATHEMVGIAMQTKPNAACLVPERREEVTTEGGLDVVKGRVNLAEAANKLKAEGIRVSLFIDPVKEQIEAAKEVGADIIELHTGTYCEVLGDRVQQELSLLQTAAAYAHSLGLEVHAGHGLRYDNVVPVAAISELVELNIGHFLIGESIFSGLTLAVQKMRDLMDEARSGNVR